MTTQAQTESMFTEYKGHQIEWTGWSNKHQAWKIEIDGTEAPEAWHFSSVQTLENAKALIDRR